MCELCHDRLGTITANDIVAAINNVSIAINVNSGILDDGLGDCVEFGEAFEAEEKSGTVIVCTELQSLTVPT